MECPRNNVTATVFVNTSLVAGTSDRCYGLAASYQFSSLFYSAIQNEVNFLPSNAGAHKSDDEEVEREFESSYSNFESDCDEAPERESESSSLNDEGECECDGQNGQSENDPSVSHHDLCDDRNEEAMHPAVSSGDLGRVVELKAQRSLTDHKK